MMYYRSSKVCVICKTPMPRAYRSDAAYCSPTCRKRAERARKNHEKKLLELVRFIDTLEKSDLESLRKTIDTKLAEQEKI